MTSATGRIQYLTVHSLRRLLVAFFFAALGLAALRDLARLGPDLPWRVMYDFPDFYCAGATLDERANPYTYEPLRSCEHRVNRAPSLQANPALAIPAPQPPYAFPAFMALARMDFAQARAIYAIAIVVAVLVTALVLGRLKIPFDVALLALALSAGYHQLDAGQITPFVLLALATTGWALAERRDVLAGVFAALTALEPHLGVSVMLAVLLFVPRARPSLIAMGLLMLGCSLVVARPSVLFEYVTRVLPAQGAAEIGFPPQYSLTYALHVFGAPDALAFELGAISFVALLVIGLALAPRLSIRLQSRELLAFFPAATVVMAGVYVHATELCFAIPAALVFACRAPGIWRTVAAIALALLSVPWILAWSFKKLWLAGIFVVAALLYRLRVSRAVGVATVLAVTAVVYIFERHPPWLPIHPPSAATSYAGGALVQTEWSAVVRSLDVHDPLWLRIKIPAWCALAAILATGVVAGAAAPTSGRRRTVK